MPPMRRPGKMGLALTAFEVWRRLPPAQRRMILDSARKQAPRAARRPGAMGVALTAFEVWRRLPPAQRRMILYSAREQAPRAAAAAVAYWRARKPR